MNKFLRFSVCLVVLTVLGISGASASAAPALTRVSRDPYTNATSQHHTQVEPDTFAYGSTIVSAFQVGRFFSGGASNIGWATSTDSGTTWTHGFLPNTTVYSGGLLQRISDPSVAYDAKHATWLITALGLGNAGQNVVSARSTDGGLTWQNPVVLTAQNNGYDKTWVSCDNTAASPYYGNCYSSWDDAGDNGLVYVSSSSNGGTGWNTSSIPNTSGLGVQPLAQPNGTLVILYLGFDDGIYAVRSPDGGGTWETPHLIAQMQDHAVAGNLRTEPLPSAEMDANGTIYLVWQDCRFIKNCTANDIVLTTSGDGVNWSPVTRVPLDKRKSGVDHFIPGIGVDPATAGATAHLALTYYYYPNTACSTSSCRLYVGFATSTDGGATWSSRRNLAGPMQLSWLPNTTLGYMVGDYLSTSFVNGKAIPVFADARVPKAKLRQQMNAPTIPLPIRAGTLAAESPPVMSKSDHPTRARRTIP